MTRGLVFVGLPWAGHFTLQLTGLSDFRVPMTLLLLASGSSKVILHFPPNTAPLRVSWFGAPGLSPSPLLRHSCSAEGLLMSRLYPRKPSNGSSALRFNSCPIYLEFLSLSQLPPLYTSGIVLGHWAPSQRQSMANPSHSHSASFPPLAGKKKKKYFLFYLWRDCFYHRGAFFATLVFM